MTQVRIKHNPFTVETTFLIDGVELTDGARLHRCTKMRMQLWVDDLFDELTTMFNGQNEFNVMFMGVEPDFRDLEFAAAAAREKDMKISLAWNKAASAESRLAEVEKLREEVLGHPGYAPLLKDNADARAALLDSANQDFDVYVVATMSSGKSTLINSMLGRDLLPAGNEATTATITRIYDNQAAVADGFRGQRFDASGERLGESEDMDLVTMRVWNKDPETSLIELHGCIAAAQNIDHARVVLTDTPGPNNSSDEMHSITTMSYIQDKTRNPLILYVLNATQRGITDDAQLLKLVANTIIEGGRQASDRFIFVLNKMDEMDGEKGDDVKGMLTRTRAYLQSHGIVNPQIFPVSAYAAHLIRSPEGLLSTKERGAKRSFLEWFATDPSMDLGSYSPLRMRERKMIEAIASDLERRSGLPALEAAVRSYIEKYHLPDRFKRNYDAMASLIEEAINRYKGIEELELGDLQKLTAEIQRVMARYGKGLDVTAIAEQLVSERMELPLQVEQDLVRISAKVTAFEREDMARFSGRAAPEKARHLAREWGEVMSFRYKEVINNYQAAYEEGQKSLKSLLQNRYEDLVSETFEDVDMVQFPALARIMRSAAGLSFDPKISDGHTKTRRIIMGTEEVMDRQWLKPSTWFKPKVVPVYGDEVYVDLTDFYKQEVTEPRAVFNQLKIDARTAMEVQAKKLLDVFIEHVHSEFKPRVMELLTKAEALTKDRDLQKKALGEARELREYSERLQIRLQQTLDIQDVSL